MRISDWSSDVCSSDLRALAQLRRGGDAGGAGRVARSRRPALPALRHLRRLRAAAPGRIEADPGQAARAARELGAHRPRCRGHPASRSEEHTPELQSLMRYSYAVFCLKKTHTKK